MKYNYNRTFDTVNMPPDQQEKIRLVLSSRISEKQKEDNSVYTKSTFNKKLRIAVIAAVLMLALSVTAIAATYGLWQPVWAEYFGVNGNQQADLMGKGVTVLIDGASVFAESLSTEATFTITAEQVIGDKHTLQILLKFESDTPGAFTEEFIRNTTILNPINIYINGQVLRSGGRFLQDMATDYSCYYCSTLDCSIDDWKGSTLELEGVYGRSEMALEDLDDFNRRLQEIAEINPLRMEDWKLSFSLEALADSTTTVELNQSVDIAGETVTVDYVDLSPVSLYIKYASGLDESLEPLNGELTLSGGTTISFNLNSACDYNDWSYFLDYKTYEGVLDVSQIVSINLRNWDSQEIIAQISLQ